MGKASKKSIKKKKASPTFVTKTEDMDEKSLEKFLKKVSHDEIKFDEWQSVHSSLDVKVLLFLSEAELQTSVTRTVQFSRTRVLDTAEKQVRQERERLSVEVEIPPFAPDGHTIFLEKMGDHDGQQYGQLQVIVKRK